MRASDSLCVCVHVLVTCVYTAVSQYSTSGEKKINITLTEILFKVYRLDTYE